jgi:hypothetical protein
MTAPTSCLKTRHNTAETTTDNDETERHRTDKQEDVNRSSAQQCGDTSDESEALENKPSSRHKQSATYDDNKRRRSPPTQALLAARTAEEKRKS